MVRRAVLVAVLVAATAGVLLWQSRARGPDPRPPAEEPTPEGPWTLVVNVRDPAGAEVAADVWVTNQHDDLIEMVRGQAGEELTFRVSGRVAVRVAAEDLAPGFLDGLSAPVGTEKRLTVALEPGLSISGTILEPEGDVRIRGGRFDVIAEALDPPWTRARGEGWDADPRGGEPWEFGDSFNIRSDWSFGIHTLPPGRYRLHVYCSWDEYGAADEPIVLAGAAGVEIQLAPKPPDARLKFRFVDTTTREPPPDVSWELTPDDGEDTWSGGVSWTEIRIPPGMKGTLEVDADGYLPHDPLPIVGGAPGEETEVVCEFVPDPGVWAELDLVLLDEEGLPVVNAEVSRGWKRAVSREDGRYRLRVPAGSWRISAEPDWQMVDSLLTFWLPHDEEIRFGRGERVEREWTVKRGGLILVRGEVEGSPWIVLDGKHSVLGKRWLLRTQQPIEWIDLVPAGAYRVEARCRGRLAGAEVEVRAGEVTTVTFPLAR